MFEVKFYPGGAASALEVMSEEQKKTKNKVLRELIAKAKIIDAGPYQEAFEFFTEAGRQIKALAKNPKKMNAMVSIAKDCHALGKSLEHLPMPKINKSRRLDETKDWKSPPMTFRPKEQERKLEELAIRSDMSKAAVLRALILGISLPDNLIRRTYSRLSQIGGLCKSIAYSWQSGPWKELERYGINIHVMACKKLYVIHDIFFETSDVPPGAALPKILH